MAELYGSKRTAERATLTPIKRRKRNPDRPEEDHGNAWQKWSYFAALSPSAAEFAKIAERMPNATDSDRQHLQRLGKLVAQPHDVPRVSLAVDSARHLSEVPSELLERVGQTLAAVREQAREDALAAQKELLAVQARQPATPQAGEPGGGDEPVVPPGYELDPTFVDPAMPGYRMYRMKESRPTLTEIGATAAEDRPDPLRAARVADTARLRGATHHGTTASEGFFLAPPVQPQPLRSTSISTGPSTINELVEAGVRAGVDDRLLERATMSIVRAAPLDGTMTLMDYETKSGIDLNHVKDYTVYYAAQQQNEPIGMLHLERLNFIPAGIERGELMSSVPLSPGEEVNISHKEWSNTSEEFTRIVTDYLEEYSEQGVVEKAEFSQSTSSQSQHSSGFNMSVTASGGYGPVSVTTSLGYNVAESASASEATARQQSSEVTRKAASRTRKEHKVSFKVASAAGTEDQAVRKIKNPFDDKATPIDFYQLVRKWQVDLYRYGVRLTYDLTIPEPGSDVLSKISEMNELRMELEEPFGPSGMATWSNFVLKPNEVTRSNYAQKAAQYGVAIEAPLPNYVKIAKSFSRNWANIEETEYGVYISNDVEVPDGYEVYSAWAGDGYAGVSGTVVTPDTPVATRWPGASGRLTRSVWVFKVYGFATEIVVWAKLKKHVYEAWQMRAWATLRDAAKSRYEAHRALIKERLSKLQEELGGQDPLSLRKIEREEVMKGVLRWLFGPSFEFVPPVLSSDLYDADEVVKSNAMWGHVLAHGQIIKFLHHAIEWENMTYFLYPYFWSHTSRWELKKYLDHPDFLHRAFLKAGAARVVLTVRPGFETDFVSFVETGNFTPLPGSHPYLTIAQEIEAFAKTNYPGIRAANPQDAARPLLSPLQRKAWKSMEGIVALLEKFKTAQGRYPNTAEGLAALAPYGTIDATDPWGNDLAYTSPGKVSISSYGRPARTRSKAEPARMPISRAGPRHRWWRGGSTTHLRARSTSHSTNRCLQRRAGPPMATVMVGAPGTVEEVLNVHGLQGWRASYLIACGQITVKRSGALIDLKVQRAATPLLRGDELNVDRPVPAPCPNQLATIGASAFRDYAMVSIPISAQDAHIPRLRDFYDVRPQTIRLRPTGDALKEFIDMLTQDAAVIGPIRDLMLGCHAAPQGSVMVKATAIEGSNLMFERLEKAVTDRNLIVKPEFLQPRPKDASKADLSARFVIRGCAVGTALPFLRKFKEALGGSLAVVAPKYEHAIGEYSNANVRALYEFLAYEFLLHRPTPLATDQDIRGAFIAEGLLHYDNKPIEAKTWETWIPAGRPPRDRHEHRKYFSKVANRQLTGFAFFTTETHNFPLNPVAVNLPFDPGTDAARAVALGVHLNDKEPRFKPTHPWPGFMRLGYKTLSDMISGYTWTFRYDSAQQKLVCNGTRTTYTVHQPIVDTSNSALIHNHYPIRPAGTPTEVFTDRDTRFFVTTS